VVSFQFSGRAILFDLDGVLVDSTAAVTRVWQEWARTKNLRLDDVIAIAQHGRRTIDVVGELLPSEPRQAEVAFLETLELSELDSLVAMPGARELLDELRTTPWAIATSGLSAVAKARLRQVGLPVPDVLVGADDVRHGKPDPEPYLRAAERLNIAPADCLAFEDAPAGIAAAKRAGACVIALATTHGERDLYAADAIALNLGDVRARESPGNVSIEITRMMP
jgi:sugar-phosphatase